MTASGAKDTLIGSLHTAEKTYSVHSDSAQKTIGDSISLHEILHRNHKPRPDRAHRLGIALAVACSHLQLKSTSWARKQWQTGDILFPTCSTSSMSPAFDKPYVSADFSATTAVPAGQPQASDRSFACLGIMLLELAFGVVLEDHEMSVLHTVVHEPPLVGHC